MAPRQARAHDEMRDDGIDQHAKDPRPGAEQQRIGERAQEGRIAQHKPPMIECVGVGDVEETEYLHAGADDQHAERNDKRDGDQNEQQCRYHPARTPDLELAERADLAGDQQTKTTRLNAYANQVRALTGVSLTPKQADVLLTMIRTL